MDEALAAGLQALLDFEEGTGSIEEVFGVDFTASANPLLAFLQPSTSTVGAGTSATGGKESSDEIGFVEHSSNTDANMKVCLHKHGSRF